MHDWEENDINDITHIIYSANNCMNEETCESEVDTFLRFLHDYG